MKRICVFCGSSKGRNPRYLKQAIEFGKWISANNFELVYGGGSVGLMGAVSDSVMAEGGIVHGVIPTKLIEMEVQSKNVTYLYEVSTMHERKQKMYDLSDVFIALPGGLGTLDEIFEILTWAQIGYHVKKCYILNTFGFYDFLIKHLDYLLESDFLSKEHYQLINIIDDPCDILV